MVCAKPLLQLNVLVEEECRTNDLVRNFSCGADTRQPRQFITSRCVPCNRFIIGQSNLVAEKLAKLGAALLTISAGLNSSSSEVSIDSLVFYELFKVC